MSEGPRRSLLPSSPHRHKSLRRASMAHRTDTPASTPRARPLLPSETGQRENQQAATGGPDSLPLACSPAARAPLIEAKHFVEYNGRPVTSVKTAFKSAVRLAELRTPHEPSGRREIGKTGPTHPPAASRARSDFCRPRNRLTLPRGPSMDRPLRLASPHGERTNVTPPREGSRLWSNAAAGKIQSSQFSRGPSAFVTLHPGVV